MWCDHEESKSPSQSSVDHLDILDEEMHGYMRIAKSLMKTLKLPKDVEFCERILRRCAAMDNTMSINVKANRNVFLKYFLKVLRWTSVNQPLEHYDNWLADETCCPKTTNKETSFWSDDKRSYIAAKTISNCGILVYLAVASEPELGWQEGGFTTYDF